MGKKDERNSVYRMAEIIETDERKAKMLRNVIARVNGNPKLRQAWQNRADKSKARVDFPYPDHISVEHLDMENFRMEFLTRKDINSGYAILQLHGGGYISGMQDQYRKMAGLYAEVSRGASVLTIDYRLAPEHPFPAALEDAFCAFDWLREKGYDEKHIILAGDSAGGGLAIALCHYLKQKGRALPAGVVAMSPWTDLTISGASYKERAELDPVFGHNGDGEMLKNSPYIGNDNPENPLISPLFGDFKGFPPMLIQVGSHEMLYDDAASVAKKAREAGCSVRLTVYDGMFHVFQMAGTVIKDSKKAWEEVGAFIRVIGGRLYA